MFPMLLSQAQPPEDVGEALRGLTPWDWGRAGIIFVSGLLLAWAASRIVRRVMQRSGGDRVPARLVGRMFAYVIGTAGFAYALGSLEVDIGLLVGALGIGGIALAFALQDTIENLISGIVLETRNMYRRGDQIMTNSHEGFVEDMNLRHTIVRTYDGERVFVPNAMVMQNPIVNFTAFGPRRTTLVLGVSYDTDLRRAQQVLLKAMREADGVLEAPEPEAYVVEFADSSINFDLRFWHQPGRANLFAVRDTVAQSVKRALDDAGITVPFPQRTLWFPDRLQADVEAQGDGSKDRRSERERPS